jgi:hypothetical protein
MRNQIYLVSNFVLKLSVFISFSLLLLLLLVSCNDLKGNKKQNNTCTDTNMNYYSKKVVVMWNLPEEEREVRLKDVHPEIEADIYYYFTMAQYFLHTECDKINIKVKFDDNDCCGFVFDSGDTVKLREIDFEEVDDIWKIILFDGIKQPKVVSPVLIEDDYYEYFNIKKEEDKKLPNAKKLRNE